MTEMQVDDGSLEDLFRRRIGNCWLTLTSSSQSNRESKLKSKQCGCGGFRNVGVLNQGSSMGKQLMRTLGPYPKPFRACRRYGSHMKQWIYGMRTKQALIDLTEPLLWLLNMGAKMNYTTLLHKFRRNRIVPVIFIGTERHPRCFQDKSAADHGFDYGHNKKRGWPCLCFLNGWYGSIDS